MKHPAFGHAFLILFLISPVILPSAKSDDALPPEAIRQLAAFKEQLKESIANASAMDASQIRRIASAAATPPLIGEPSQPLSLVLICKSWSPEIIYESAPDGLNAEFSLAIPLPNSARLLWDAFVALDSPSGRDSATLLSPERVDVMETRLDGSKLEGVFRFAIEDVASGKISFFASWRDQRWQITEFRLPARKIFISLNAQGAWQAKRDDSATKADSIRLPKVEIGLKRRSKSFPRYVVWVKEGSLWSSNQILTDSLLKQTAMAFLAGHTVDNPVAELRVDRETHSRVVCETVSTLHECGFQRFSLAAVTEEFQVVDLFLSAPHRPNHPPSGRTAAALRVKIENAAENRGVLIEFQDVELPSQDALLPAVFDAIDGFPSGQSPVIELRCGPRVPVQRLAEVLQRVSMYRDDKYQAVTIVDQVFLLPAED